MSNSNAELANVSLVAKPLVLSPDVSHQSVFAALADKPWSIWLDSCETQHVDSQYHIMVWQPVVTVEAFSNETIVKSQQNYHALAGSYSGDPLNVLENIQQQVFANIALPDNSLPFVGGSLGYFSYDLGRCFETVPVIAKNDINQPLMSIGIYLQAIVFNNKTKEYWLVAPENNWQQIAEQITNATPNERAPFALTSQWQANMSKAEYQQKFNRVHDYILAGDCYQINLAQRFTAHYQGDEYNAYLKLRESNQAPFSAFMRFEDHSVVSISPERFLKVEGRNVQTKPIKGTLPRSLDAEIDSANAQKLQQSTKDRAENLMIVDLLRNDISRVCQAGSVKVPKLFDIESFPAVHHLVSTVEGELAADKSCTDLLRASFPGGSITGAPKIRAMEIIEELEPHQRNLYCGSIGYISANGNMDTSITIRTLICKNQQIHCWAGGGLVADSKVDSEYQETFDKVRKILPILEG